MKVLVTTTDQERVDEGIQSLYIYIHLTLTVILWDRKDWYSQFTRNYYMYHLILIPQRVLGGRYIIIPICQR